MSRAREREEAAIASVLSQENVRTAAGMALGYAALHVTAHIAEAIVVFSSTGASDFLRQPSALQRIQLMQYKACATLGSPWAHYVGDVTLKEFQQLPAPSLRQLSALRLLHGTRVLATGAGVTLLCVQVCLSYQNGRVTHEAAVSNGAAAIPSLASRGSVHRLYASGAPPSSSSGCLVLRLGTAREVTEMLSAQGPAFRPLPVLVHDAPFSSSSSPSSHYPASALGMAVQRASGGLASGCYLSFDFGMMSLYFTNPSPFSSHSPSLNPFTPEPLQSRTVSPPSRPLPRPSLSCSRVVRAAAPRRRCCCWTLSAVRDPRCRPWLCTCSRGRGRDRRGGGARRRRGQRGQRGWPGRATACSRWTGRRLCCAACWAGSGTAGRARRRAAITSRVLCSRPPPPPLPSAPPLHSPLHLHRAPLPAPRPLCPRVPSRVLAMAQGPSSRFGSWWRAWAARCGRRWAARETARLCSLPPSEPPGSWAGAMSSHGAAGWAQPSGVWDRAWWWW